MKLLRKNITFIILITFCLSLTIFVGCKDIKYKVSFMVDDVLYAEVYTTSSKPIKMPKEPIKTGYTFEGWFMDNELQSETFSNLVLTRDLTVYAHFTPKTYNVELNANGGSCDVTSIECVYDETYNLPTPTKDMYRFLGWYYGNTLIDNDVWIYETTELTAKWEFIEYTVDTDGVDVVVSELLPAEQRFIGQLNVQVDNNIDCYVFVKIDCENKDYLELLSFNTDLFQKYEDVYFYLAPANTTTIIFADTITLSVDAGNEYQNIGDITLNFSTKAVQAVGTTLEDAYNEVYVK